MAFSSRSSAASQHLIYLHRRYLFIILEEMNGRGHLGEWELMVLLALMRLGEDAYGDTFLVARDASNAVWLNFYDARMVVTLALRQLLLVWRRER